MNDTIPPKMKSVLQRESRPSQRCYGFLKEGILTGYYKRGHRIVERDLIELLGVSRTPLREALRRLEQEHLIEHNRNKGCTVIGLTGHDIRELYDLRKLLEPFMLEVVCKSATDDELKHLRNEVIRKKDDFTIDGEYWSPHIHLLELSRHRRLQITLGPLVENIERINVLSFRREGRREKAYAEHLAIVDALIDRDAPTAKQLLQEHLEASLAAMEDILAYV